MQFLVKHTVFQHVGERRGLVHIFQAVVELFTRISDHFLQPIKLCYFQIFVQIMNSQDERVLISNSAFVFANRQW